MSPSGPQQAEVPRYVVEVFADVGCPFTHVGLRRFVEVRAELDRFDVGLLVRSWPLEIVNDLPLDPHFIAEEIDEIREQVAPSLFSGFEESAFPSSSMPALGLAVAAYRESLAKGEEASLLLRDLLFEHGEEIARLDVLDRIATDLGISRSDDDLAGVRADHAEGVERGVIGSPHFFTPGGAFFCPALNVGRDTHGHLQILTDPAGFDAFVAGCFP